MNASIYTMNNASEIAYQLGNKRIVIVKNGMNRTEIRDKGVWRQALGYIKPGLIDAVKQAIAVA